MVGKKRKIRVAFCLRDMKIGGVESVLTRTLDKLSQYSDLQITVITYTSIRGEWRGWFDAHKNISVRTLYPCKLLGTDLPHFFLFRLVKHIVRDVYRWGRRVLFNKRMFRNLDVVIDYYDFDCARELSKLKIPRIAWWHSSSDKFNDGKYVRYLRNYEKFVVLTDAFAEELRKKYPDYADKIMRIYNPLNVDMVREKAKWANVHRGDFFVCVSRLVNGKDIKTLIHAFNKFWQNNKKPNIDLLIVGDGYARTRFESIAKSVAASKHIVFAGAVDNPFGFMRGARANILSSVGEGLPTVLLEGSALGTLNIASDCPNGPREILMNGRAGLLFPVGDIDMLAKHLTAVYNDTADVKKMISVANKNMKRFDAAQIADQIHDLILHYI